MKNLTFLTFVFVNSIVFSQEHFSGISTSRRVGIINSGLNPAELMNLNGKMEFNIFSASTNITNNKIGFKDILDGGDIEELLFKGDAPVNFKADAEIYGPSFAINVKKWAFGITTKVNAKIAAVEVNAKLLDAFVNNNITGLPISTNFNNDYNQRMTGTTWGELGLTAATNLVNSDKHKLNVGVTFKLLFPGSYANFGVDKFNGNLNILGTDNYVNNATAGLNVAYSGDLANSFISFNDYYSSLIGCLNGFAGDIGVNYQLIDNASNAKNAYKLNIGASFRNIGTMTFENDNNYATNYKLNIQPTFSNPFGQNIEEFSGIDNLKDIENILVNNGFLNITPEQNEFVVNLPTVFSGFADVKVISKFFLTGFLQRRIKSNNNNDQITSQNLWTVTPRFSTKYFEFCLPISNSEIAGSTTGFGIRLGGFFLGSSSLISALTSDTKQADFNTGFRWSFL